MSRRKCRRVRSRRRGVSIYLSLGGLLVTLTASAVQAQNPIKDGHIYYFTGAATISTSLVDFAPLAVGNDIVIGRAPGGVYGADGDINLGTSLASAYTVTFAAGASIWGNYDRDANGNDADGYVSDVSVFNYNRVVIDNDFNVFNLNAYDNSRVDMNSGSFYNFTGWGSSQIVINNSGLGTNFDGDSVLGTLYGRDSSQLTVHGGLLNGIAVSDSSHLLMTGGTMGSIDLSDTAQADFQGGSVIGVSTIDGSAHLSVSDGQLNTLFLRGSSAVSVSGGASSSFIANDAAQVTISGGALNKGAFYDSSKVSISGGSVNALSVGLFNQNPGASHATITGGFIGTLDAATNALVDLRGGGIGGPIHLLDSSFLNIYGGGLIITGTTPWSETIDGNVRTGIAYNVTGILQNNGATLSSFLIYDQDAGFTQSDLNPARQFSLIDTGNTPLTVDGHIYYITAPLTIGVNLTGYDVVIGKRPDGVFGAPGDTDLGATDADKYTVTFAAGAKTDYNADSDGYFGAEVHNRNKALVTGGTLASLTTYDSSVAEIQGGSVNALQTYGTSQGLVNGGKLSSGANAYGSSRLDVVKGNGGSIYALENSTVSVSGGVVSDLSAFDAAHLAVSGGSVGSLTASDTATVNISDGTIDKVTFGQGAPFRNAITANGNSTVNISGGTVGGLVLSGADAYSSSIQANDNSTINISGGTVGGAQFSVPVNGFYAYGVSADGSSQVNMSNGSVGGIDANGNAQVNVTGGSIGEYLLSGNSDTMISGGSAQFAFLSGSATLAFTGGVFQAGNLNPAGFSRIRANNQSTVVIGGSATYDRLMVDGSATAFVGGNSIGKQVDVTNQGTASISGGTIGALKADTNGVVNLTGGTLLSSPYLLDSSFLNIYGHDLQITGTSAWSQNLDGGIRSGLVWNVSGFLQNNSSLSNFTIYDQDAGFTTSTLNPIRQFTLFGSNPIAIDGKIFYALAPTTISYGLPGYDVVIGRGPAGAYGAAGDINLGTTDADKYTVTLGPGTVTGQNDDLSDGYNGVHVYNKNTALLTGGFVAQLSTHDSATADIRGNAFVSSLNASDASQVLFNGAGLSQTQLTGSSSLSIAGGVVGSVAAHDSSSVSVNGGATTSLQGFDAVNLTVSGGAIGTLVANDAATATISGGNIRQAGFYGGPVTITSGNIGGVIDGTTYAAILHNDATVTMSGGDVHFLYADDNSVFNITGGIVGNFEGPLKNLGGIRAFDNSTINMSGGDVEFITIIPRTVPYTVKINVSGGKVGDRIETYGGAHVSISGMANVAEFDSYENTVSEISGGALGIIALHDNAHLTMTGGSVNHWNMTEQSDLSFSGGHIVEIFPGYSSHADISGGSIDLLQTYEHSTTDVRGTADIVKVVVGESSFGAANAVPVLNLSGGTIDDLTVENHATINMSGGIVNTALVGKSTFAPTDGDTVLNLAGGTIGSLTVENRGSVNFSGGAIGRLDIYGNAVVNQSGGKMNGLSIGNGLYGTAVNDNATFTMSGGSNQYVVARNNATINVSGGKLNGTDVSFNGAGGVTAHDNSTVNVSGGDLLILWLEDGPGTVKADVSGGHITQALTVEDNQLSVRGGAVIDALYAYQSSITNQYGGTVNQASLSNSSVLTLTGGTVNHEAAYNNSATYLLTGGHIGTIQLFNNSKLYILGGTIGNNTIYALGDTLTDLSADSYTFTFSDPNAATFLDTNSGITYTGFFHDLSAVFGDGSLLSTHYFEAVSDNSGTLYHPQFVFNALGASVPDAPSGLLFLSGVLFVGAGGALRFWFRQWR